MHGNLRRVGCLAYVLVAYVMPLTLLASTDEGVRTRMQHVNFHLGHGVELQVSALSGRLVSTSMRQPPTFDDVGSYVLEIESARVAMTPASLTNLMNNVVFASGDTPIKNLKIEIEGRELKQSGVLKKGIDVPFTMRATLDVTPEGRLRIHPISMKAAGFVSKRVLDFFGLELEKLIKLKPESPVKVDRDDLLLDPERLLPPPRIRGKLTRAWIADGLIFEQFGPETPGRLLVVPDSGYRNYMYVDDDAKDLFDFSPAQYDAQLIAGYSKNTSTHGLITHMPDLNDLSRKQSPRK
jgi:hypothetical protein